jgi:hypothetical protein
MENALKDVWWRLVGTFHWIFEKQESAAALISALVTVIGLFLALIPIYVSIRQNRAERTWRRSEVVRSLLSQLTDNPNIALIARVLDWREGPAPVPELFRPMFDSITPPADRPRMFFEIEWARFIEALPIDRTGDDWRTPDLFMYRTCFDSFCSFIQSVADDVRTIGAREAEYADLSFYCHRVAFPKDKSKIYDQNAGRVLREFIENYYNKKTYDVILRHAELYAITHPEDELHRASTHFPVLFRHRSALKRARQRRDHKASISPRDIKRRRRYSGFRAYRKAVTTSTIRRMEHSRSRWQKHIRFLCELLQWLGR